MVVICTDQKAFCNCGVAGDGEGIGKGIGTLTLITSDRDHCL